MRKATILFALIIFLSTNALGAYGAYGFSKKQIIIAWGPSYRITDKLYHHFEFTYESYSRTCTGSDFKGLELRIDWFNNDNFSIGIKSYKTFRRLSGIYIIPYCGISPEYFLFENQSGLNLKPEVGLRFEPFQWSPVDINLNVSYGYHVPIISENQYTTGRHDLSASIGLAFNVYMIRNLFKRKKDNESQTEVK